MVYYEYFKVEINTSLKTKLITHKDYLIILRSLIKCI